jgi:hypothetical protein
LSKRRSDLWRALGFPEYSWWTAEWEHIARDTFGSYYTDLWLDKFDFDPVSWTLEWESAMREVRTEQETEQIFREGQIENLPPCSQDFNDYWNDGPKIENFEAVR